MAERKVRRSALEVIRKKIPTELHYLLDDSAKADKITQLWKLDDELLRSVMKSLPEEFRPVLKYKFETESDGRGAKSLLPYSKEDITKAAKYMDMKPGIKVVDTEGSEYALATVQVLIKAKSGDKTVTIALSRMA